MQQGGSGSHYGASASQLVFGETQQQQVVEEASPISSRPPAAEQIMGGSSSGGTGLMVDEDDADRGSGNRWPRQQTLALIQIRSEMDAAFRDATVKAPLWEDVSRKLAELGYKRSAKKCKEKFENVHKYYKRTKEGRAGRQDGKSYRFFSQLEALHNVTSPSSTTINVSSAASQQQPPPPPTTGLDVAPVSVGIPVPMSSQPPPPSTTVFPPGFTTSSINPPPTSLGVSFSSDGSSSSSPTTEEDKDDDDTEGLPSTTATGGSRKRKRESHHKGETRQMMEFFEGLMKQVMQKQEAMQQRFLEAIEKREQDRMIREEAWKRQEMARLSREHEMMAQERAVSASRDAAIVSFLQKITGQTIHLPSPITVPAAPPQPPPQPQPPPAPQFPVPPIVTTRPQQQVVQPPPPPKPSQSQQLVQRQQPAASSDIIMAIPEQQVPPQAHQMEIVSMSGGMEAGSSSRWPKAEVIALINLRSGLETKYQESGPKGPLWEEISAGMQRLGYNRSAKRCKEKWENINKYYKKVKESNKKRPEDSKTCPYFHQLDALYRKKILGTTAEASTGVTTGFAIQSRPEDQRQPENQPLDRVPAAANVVQEMQASESQTKNDASNTSMGTGGATKKPEDIDIVKELMEKQGQLMVDDIGDHESEEDEEDEEDEGDESESQEEGKMAYKIEFQRQNTNGRRNGAPPSFLAMVQ